jgi:hypothetical protein
MEQEVRATLAPFLTGRRPAQDLLTAKYVYANRALAQFYGLPDAGTRARRPLRQGHAHRRQARRRAPRRQPAVRHLAPGHATRRPAGASGSSTGLLCRKPAASAGDGATFEPNEHPEGTLRQKLERLHVAMGASCRLPLASSTRWASRSSTTTARPLARQGQQPSRRRHRLMPEHREKFDGAAQLAI